jgi:hypothetical protein
MSEITPADKSGAHGPLHGVPDDRAHFLDDLLDEARRLRDLGRPADEVRRAVIALNRNLGRQAVPPFSAGGLVECVNAVLAEGPGGGR